MSVHSDFIYRLAELVEYAETHNLKIASMILAAAVEEISPTVAKSHAQIIQAPCAAKAVKGPFLRLIQGGRAAQPN